MIRKLANLIEIRLSERLCEDLVVFVLTLPLLGLITASLAHGPESFDESTAHFAVYPTSSMVMPAR
ncbi:hypothetical protein NKH54_24365 [Mesorhizobium sp. M1004]|uniref:hypothetical protein n=1 Tax=Mesorhizobium sp. M1004 TaxID=2957046 RepID=UPI00333D0703